MPASPNSFLPLTPATFHILLTLAPGPMHGYAVKREVEERTGGVVRLGAGTLYAGIQRMERDGLIEETDAPDAGDVEPSARWRFYRLTPLGNDVLRAERARLERDLEYARSLRLGSGTSRAR
jgi:DNA-binding PadR family transcriptional regulator